MQQAKARIPEWNRIIEDVLDCPICLKCTDSSYIICTRGHYVCKYCMKQITKCPMCYNLCIRDPIRHLVADELISRLVEIQLSIDEDVKLATTKTQKDQSVQTDLLITKSSVVQTDNRLITKSSAVQTDNRLITKSSVTQTDDLLITESSIAQRDEINFLTEKSSGYTQSKIVPTVAVRSTSNNKFNFPHHHIKKPQHVATLKVNYPCLIGCCTFNASYEELEKHLCQRHPFILERHNGMEYYEQNFVVPKHKLPWDYEYVIIFHQGKIKRIYFVNFLLRSSRSLKCCVRYSKSYILPTPPQYTVTVDSKLKFTGEVKPSSIPVEAMYDLVFSEKEMSAMLQTDSIIFTFGCS